MNRYRKTRLPGSNADNRNVSGVRRWRNAGFTLLEVLLALSLSVLVIAAIASAIHLNVSVLQRQQVNIEQAQVARNVLMIISGDLRAAFQYKPADVTGLDELSVSQAQIAGIASGADLSETDISQLDPGLPDAGGGDPAAIDPGALASATGQSGASPGMTAGSQSSSGFSGMASNSSSSGANQNIAAGAPAGLRPGLYGNSTELMVDISRLPRIDQYSPVVLGTSGPVSLPTDLKTIAWFLANESVETDSMLVGLPTSSGGGLYRRELDRAVAAFNLDVAGTLATGGFTRLIANEVIGLEFRYFNGSDWQTEWDSEAEGGFPSAVEVTIVVDPQRQLRESTRAEFQLADAKAYRAVVYLPIAEILPEDELLPAGTPQTGGGP